MLESQVYVAMSGFYVGAGNQTQVLSCLLTEPLPGPRTILTDDMIRRTHTSIKEMYQQVAGYKTDINHSCLYINNY